MADPVSIHPTAVVSTQAQLGDDVAVGAFVVIEGPVIVGRNCRIDDHAQLVGDLTIGNGCRIGAGSILGDDPQDLGFDPATSSGVRIGDDNVLGENVTIHRSASSGAHSRVGIGNRLERGVHFGHDVQVGDRNVFEPRCMLAGHVEVGDGAHVGEAAGIHQFVRLGDGIRIESESAITKDIPPFIMVSGANHFDGIHESGLKESGHGTEACDEIGRVLRVLFGENRPLRDAIARAEGMSWGEEAARVIQFVANSSRKGMMVPRLDGASADRG